MQAAIYGLAGPAMSEDERAFFKDADPAGYIIFGRNCIDQQQLLALTEELRGLSGRADVPILIDQEGGRVARMREPEWPAFPAAEAFDRLYRTAPSSALEAVRSNARALGLMLREAGINVDCLPLLDVRQPGAHDIIGDRALGDQPMQVAALGQAVLSGLASAGVSGVIKHMPGHGRALADSHVELPVVTASEGELEADIEPFERLKGAFMGMTAHVVYTAWDKERPASLSPSVIAEIIRGRIGFDGWLMSDDIGMQALEGDFGERASGVVAAGCDVALHCSGDMDEMVAVAAAVPPMSAEGEARLARAMDSIAAADDDGPDFAQCVAKRDELLALA
ncbi:MAG: beta-N-acetylhexosaminidase [Sphingomicrobium sp.]